MKQGAGGAILVDALIVTAVPDEYSAVLAVETGAEAGRGWEKHRGSTGLEVAVREFATAAGPLRIAMTQALGMGGVEAVSAAAALVPEYQVRCLAMCGVCAGRRGDVGLGDVIIADRVWQYDTGKLSVKVVKGKRVEREQGDIEMYRIHPPAWKQAAQRFEIEAGAEWLGRRPRSYEAQGDWILERLLRGIEPAKDPESGTRAPDFGEALKRLWKQRFLRKGTRTLTAAGRRHIEEVLLLNRGSLPEAKPFKVNVGPIASGNRVIEDAEIWKRLADPVRKVLGVEMEAAAIGALAHARGLDYAVVMKAVMDHADPDKSDNFKSFAARASAECLIAFLRQHLPAREPPRVERDPLDGILVPGTSPLPAKVGPAALLNARHVVVPFHGRVELLAELRAWCEAEGSLARAWLIHAAGGMGKTRLMIELCEQMRTHGWRAGFVLKGFEPDRFAALLGSEQPTLAVIDYAESRSQLRALLEPVARRRAEGGPGRMRVVLLARNAGDWWNALLGADGLVKDLLTEQEPWALRPLVPVGSEREAVFGEAAAKFAERETMAIAPAKWRVPSLDDARYERVLYLHMAALAFVEGRSFTAETLMDDTLDHEERFWVDVLRPRGEKVERVLVPKIRRLVSALTLTGGASGEEQALALVARFCGVRDEEIALLLRDVYPGSGANGVEYVSGLEPDVLGEAMVWRTLVGLKGEAGVYLDEVFEGAEERALRTGFEVLGRLSAMEARRQPMEAWIARLLERDVVGRALAAFEAAKAIGARTVHARLGWALARTLEREGTVEVAARLEKSGIPDDTVSLRELAVWVMKAQLKPSLESAGEDGLAERARLLNNIGNRQSDVGQWGEALASTIEAVKIRRELAKNRPEEFLPFLAASLNNLGLRQSEVGQWEEALASTHEAVWLYRELARYRPGVFLADLAMSLNNLGNRQSELGQRTGALTSALEAVGYYRELAKYRPEAFLPCLAQSLHNLGATQIELGQMEEALASTHEAVKIRRELAKDRPDAFLPCLAGSLNNLGAVQSELGQWEEALAASEEAAAVVWPLFLAIPAAFARNTLVVLQGAVHRLKSLGRLPSGELLERLVQVLAFLDRPTV